MAHEIKAMTNSGAFQTFVVEEIESIDGKPYQETPADLRDQMIYITAVVDEVKAKVLFHDQLIGQLQALVPVEIRSGAEAV